MNRLCLCLAFVLVVVVVLLITPPLVSASEITIGTGASTWDYPVSSYSYDGRTQTIYLASDIGQACEITALALNVAAVPRQTMNNFTIRMKHTTLSSYSTMLWESADWTTVYQADQSFSDIGWNTFTFTTPFDYNGSDNLMVDICFDSNSRRLAGYCYATSAGSTRSLCYRCNNCSGSPLTWTTVPSGSAYVPNVRLTCGSATTAMPQFAPAGGTYDNDVLVTVTCSTSGATIH